MTRHSRLTTAYQATIPLPVRRVLRLGPGDWITFAVRGNQVWLGKRRARVLGDAMALEPTLGEWATALDDKAYQAL